MIISIDRVVGPSRFEFDTGRGCGFDFSIGPLPPFARRWFSIWFCRRCDFGFVLGRWSKTYFFGRGFL